MHYSTADTRHSVHYQTCISFSALQVIHYWCSIPAVVPSAPYHTETARYIILVYVIINYGCCTVLHKIFIVMIK